MSEQTQAVKTMLLADDDLVDLLTGGIYQITDLGRNEFGDGVRDILPATTFDDFGLLKPIAIICPRDERRTDKVYDHNRKLKNVSNIFEVYVWMDGDNNIETLDDAADIIEGLLDSEFVGAGWTTIINRVDYAREVDFQNNMYIRLDFASSINKYS